VSYRRFYFLKLSTDPVGIYTVTGCTHVDYTAPDAHVYSGDYGVDPPISVPKIFQVVDKTVQPGTRFDANAFGTAVATTVTQVAISQVGGRVGGGAGGLVGGIVGGMASQAVSTAMTKALGGSTPYGEACNGWIFCFYK